MAEISKLLEILLDGKPPRNLLTRLRSGPIRPGLVWLNSALRCGMKLAEDGKLGFESWSPEQIGAVVTVAKMIVSASLSVSVESLEPAVITIIKNTLEFCTCFLESLKFDEQDFCLKNDMAQLMEIVLVDGIGDVFNSMLCHSQCAVLKSVPVAPDDLDGVVAAESLIRNFEGIDCLKDKKQVDMGLTTLASGFLPRDAPVMRSTEHTCPHSPSSTISFAQHWGVVHVKCLPRLLLVSQELIRAPSSLGELTKDCTFQMRNSLSLRILKLIGNLIENIPHVTFDSDLLNAVLCYGNNLVTFFHHEFEFLYHETITSENAFEAQLLRLFEEFIHLVQIAFYDDIFQNIRTCVVASIFDIFDVNSWRHNQSSSFLKPPLAYCPKLVMYLLKLIKEIKDQNTQAFDWKKFDVGPLSPDLDSATSWDMHSEKVYLLRKYLPDEHLRIIFPSTKQWVDNLIHLADFLHSEGINSRLKVDRLRPGHAKTVVTSEIDSTLTHEDEALFGNLFSEASRPAVSSNGQHDQPVTGCISNFNSHHLLIHAAIDVFNFLRTCIFSPEWHALIYEDACKKFNESHISSILSALVRQSSLSDESNTVLSQRTSGNVAEICFELLNNLLVRRALSVDLEDHIVDEVLQVANGKYVYTDHTLMLLFRALISRTGVAFHQIARKIYKGFIDFILEKVKNVHSSCDDVREFVGTLPSIFHLEILLMVFHLSSMNEKAALAGLLLSSIKLLDPPPSAYNGKQLSYWGLLVSRLVMMIQHFLLYPSASPPWLPLQLRSLLRGTPSKTSFHRSFNDHAASWVATTLMNLSDFIKELPAASSLLPQLFDFNSRFTVINHNDSGIQTLGLDLNDLLTSLTWILGFWGGKKAQTVEDLILERYVFLLCWNTISAISCSGSSSIIKEINWENIELSDMKYFFLFGHFLLSNNTIISEDVNLGTVALSLLQKLSYQKITYQTVEQGWDFLRNGAWLSLLLSILRSGLWRYSMKNAIHGVEPYCIEQISKDNPFLFSSENVIVNFFQGNHTGYLIKALSSCLNECLMASQEAFFLTFDPRNCSRHVFSPSLFLRYVWYKRYKQGDIVPKDDLNSLDLESFLSLLSKLNESFLKENGGNIFPLILRSGLHGLPLHTEISSAVLISCILNVQDIVSTLDSLLKSRDIGWNFKVEDEVIRQLISSLMEIKSDRIFDDVHDKCESLCANLSNYMKEHPDYSYLYSLKQIERHLMDANSPDAIDANANETLVSISIDLMEDIRKDPLKAEIFQYYVGVEGSSNPADELFGDHHGDLLVLVNALDKCHSETVNVKVLGFFTGLLGGGIVCPHLKEMILQKFLAMDLSSISKWLEFRFLGTVVKSAEGVATAKGSSSSLRDSAMAFINHLLSEPCEQLSREFRSHIIEAMLNILDDAFVLYDLYTAKAYFSCMIQLLNEKLLVNRLLERIILLIPNLAGNDGLLQSLKYLLGFLGSILSDHGINKNISNKISGKLSLNSSFGAGSEVSRQLCTKKSTDAVVLPASQEAGSASVDCDATSADEDEDDGTSDGELASIDKDEEEDSNSERALASKVCTFTSSGSNFMEQHWYFCYTCDLTVSKGCCSVCAKVCHRGHRVVYSRSSRFFCDCGAGGVRGSSCQCLKPRKYTVIGSAPVCSSNSLQSLLPFSEDGEQMPDTDSDLDDDVFIDIDNTIKLSLPIEVQEGFSTSLQDLGMEDQVLELCNKLIPNVISRRASNILNDNNVILGEDKVLSYNVDIFQLKKAYKSGSFDMKIRADYTTSRELKGHLTSGSLTKSLLSVSGRGRLAVGEGDKVSIFDVGQLIGQSATAPVTSDKSNVKPLSKNTVRFEIVHLMFNPVIENYLVVAGYEECMVLTVNPRGEVTDRLAIELASQGAHIRRVDWVPGSQVQLLVVTDMFVKVYDLSLDNISPVHYFTLEDDSIMDATLATSLTGNVFLLVLSDSGNLFRLELSLKGDVGVKSLKDILLIPGINSASKGLSVFFSPSHRLLFLSYQDGTTVIGRLDNNAMVLSEMSALYENEHDGKHKPAALHHWKELIVDSGIFVCFSSLKLNSALTVSIGRHGLLAQNMRHAVGSALPLVGIAAYKPLSKDKTHCLVLHDDGSLQIYSRAYVEADTAASTVQAKKIGRDILSNKAITGSNPEFPLDFFEKTTCITAEVKLSGEAIKNSDSEGTKQRLASDDGFLESPSPTGFKVSVMNSNPDIVMVGFRLHVGNTSASHIPSEIKIFQRIIKLDEGMRSWYDVPFTDAESLLADEEFTITVGSTFNGSASPRIDSLEVYGRAKDDFGWKEKMDAILDMEADVLVCNSGAIGARKKYRTLKASPIQEQVLADALKLLARFYSLCRFQSSLEVEEPNLELTQLKCKNILEMIFQSDREPLLHSACCHILQAIFPKKEIYYHVKDTMRLVGVLNSIPILASMIGIGGGAATWVIKEFTAKTRAVSKIAKLRRSNLAAYLESHGSGIVDGLMDVFWGILDVEQPDTQTIHAIVVPCVELIYSYAECLALQGSDASLLSMAPAVQLLKKLLFASYESVQTSSSLAISSRLLQVPFPKQMMLATDDAVENAALAHMHSDVTGTAAGSAQSVIEDDTGTSSVQYCCDGCSTVPILRRRWHCNICPDFDLCEACYEVMDADRLPPPHSRDHPMSAIPIEIESFGDGTEVQFSMEELSAANLMQAQTDIRLHAVPTAIHVSESNESGELLVTATDQNIVSISASKRTVNSLLLRQLIIELKGWMEITSGVQAIPVMQLFYRLSSAVGGPFMDISKPENLDLKKFVEWFLDEINLGKPFEAKARSFFGEICILVFTYFTLMLRNWHQPGSDSSHIKSSNAEMLDRGYSNGPQFVSSASSPSGEHDKSEFASQLMHACSFLRQQAFVNYLMDILQQLIPNFKSSSSISENGHCLPSNSGCGSLLTIRRELPAGNFAPFFSDSYGKSHRSDMFMDYHKLLLENTFRLVYSLIRPEKQDKSVEKDKIYKTSASKDLKLDGYQDVLCSYISNPNTTFVRRYARRLFLHLCGSKTHYYSIRDSWQLSNETKKLYKLIDKSGGFQSPLSYERSVKLAKFLSAMAEIAVARPRNWQRYCSKHGDILPFLVDGIFSFGEESVVQALKLLNLALYPGKDIIHSIPKQDSGSAGANSGKHGSQSLDSKKKKKGDDSNESSAEKSFLDMEHAVELFCQKESSVLKNFIDTFLLEWNSTSVRAEAKCVLYGAWHHGNRLFKETLLSYLLQKIKCLPSYGQNIVEYIEFLTFLLGKVPDSTKQEENELITQCLTSDVIKGIFETFHSQNVLLANHPNSHIYSILSSLVEFDGYYLESEPCVACSCPEVPYSRMKLESLKFETKFTDNRIIVKCTGSYTIQSVIMNVHDARKSKSVKVLNLYYNNRPVSDLSELKNNWSLWKRAKNCHLAFNQTELKVDFPIPITACNFMIELDSFYENLQASSLESLQCPRCSRSVTDKHGICSHCHENAYQCRQCRNINYENLDSFLCNECGYSKYGRFEFNFMAKPSFLFDSMENDDDMKKGLAAIESESENAHRRYQQLMGFKRPLLKLLSSVGEHEIDSQQKDTVQQMMVSLPGPSCKINRKIFLLGMLYSEKCKAAFDSVSKSVQTLQGLRRVLMSYLQQKNSNNLVNSTQVAVSRSANNCYGCATTFIAHCLEFLQALSKHPSCKKQLVSAGILSELFENNIHHGPKTARAQARSVLCSFSEGDSKALLELNILIQKKVMYSIQHHRSMDIAEATHEELLLLTEICAVVDEFWESRLRVAFQLLFASIKLGAKHPAVSECIILPCLRIISQACTPPKYDSMEKEQVTGKPTTLPLKDGDSVNSSLYLSSSNVETKFSEAPDKQPDDYVKGQDIQLISYYEWERGASYLDFVRRQYKISQAAKATSQRSRYGTHRSDYLALKYGIRWKTICCGRASKGDLSNFELGSWVPELILSACSQSIRAEVSSLISLLCPLNSSRRFQLLSLLMSLLPATLSVGESAAEYFELFFKVIDSETARLFLTAKGCLATICKLITQEVVNIESQERSLNIDISQGFILHKLVELLNKFLEVSNIRSRFMREDLLSEVLESLLVIRGLIVQKTKLIIDCNRLLKDLLDSLLLESSENKRQFIRACISGLQIHGKEKGRTSLFILEQLCNMICPVKPEPVYLLFLNKAHTQEEFIRGSMNKNPYSSTEIGPLMRDVKNKICHQLDLLGLLEDDYGMELLVAGNIISLDLSISQVYEQVWKKSQSQMQSTVANSSLLSPGGITSNRECPPMTVTYRLQGLDGEATEPMIKELEEEREESQDPEVEFAIAGAVREFGGLEIILSMVQSLRDDLKSNQEELVSVLNLLMYCCKIRENRRALLRLGALGLLLDTARNAFSVDAMEPAEGILSIVESLTMEANESDISITQSVLRVSNEETGAGEQAKKIVLMFLERLSHSSGLKRSNKQQRNNEMVARILPYLTYGEPAAMEALIQHFDPYLQDWSSFDHLQTHHQDNPRDESLAQQAGKQRSEVENFVRVSESLKTSSCGDRLKDIILEKGITATAVKYLIESFSVTRKAGFKTSAEWLNGLKLPSIPLILSMLKGLSRGHLATQRHIDEGGIVPLLHALEGVSGENEIGARAENLLDTLSDKGSNGDGFLGEKVHKLRHATRNEMRQRALKKREELLQGLGMRQELSSDGGERIVVAQPVIEGLDDVEEEKDGLACMVCREGYTLRPNDILGVYSFSKRVNLGASSSGNSRGDCVYTTVSHFNIIHFQCHQEAKRADMALKNPKKEWEGAALRNNETLCNCIFPIRGPAVPLAQYIRYVDQYWDNINALGRADGSRLRLLTYDIVLMLARFATGASFSIDSKGGGRESNSRLLPFMIQMACHLLDQGNSSQQCRSMAKSISTYLSSSRDSPSRSPSVLSGSRTSSGSSDDTVQFVMVNSLLSESYDEWTQHLPAFLQRGIYHAYMQHTHGRSTFRLSSDLASSVARSNEVPVTHHNDSGKLFRIVHPMLIYTGLIEQLQQFLKLSRKAGVGTLKESDDGCSGSGNFEKWEVVMREKLVNMKEMVGLSKELLSWLEDMTSASDLQEAFDVMGALGVVLSGGFSNCEEFVQAAVTSGKN